MFEPISDNALPIDPPAAYCNNVSITFSDNNNVTQAAVVSGKSLVSMISWDSKMENHKKVKIEVTDPSSGEAPMVLQAKFVTPASRSSPLLVVASTAGASIYEGSMSSNKTVMSFNPYSAIFGPPDKANPLPGFCRGITCVDNTILVGTAHGYLMSFNCSGGSSVTVKKNIHEHKCAIADIATCKFDDLTASADVGGTIIVWTKACKAVSKRIISDLAITVLNVLRRQVLVGGVHGQIHIYAAATGELMAAVAAHCRAVTGISVAPESAYVLTSGEDASVRVFKLHTRKPEAYQLEFRYGDEMEDRLLVGAHFANDRGSSMVFASYDVPQLLLYKIYKKTPAAS